MHQTQNVYQVYYCTKTTSGRTESPVYTKGPTGEHLGIITSTHRDTSLASRRLQRRFGLAEGALQGVFKAGDVFRRVAPPRTCAKPGTGGADAADSPTA